MAKSTQERNFFRIAVLECIAANPSLEKKTMADRAGIPKQRLQAFIQPGKLPRVDMYPILGKALGWSPATLWKYAMKHYLSLIDK